MAKPEQSCDVVLKGGITSGVVYPLALVALAEKYRFSNIGGTSAGAIAAAAAAAAAVWARTSKMRASIGWQRSPAKSAPTCFPCFSRPRALKPPFDIFVAVRVKAALPLVIAMIKADAARLLAQRIAGRLARPRRRDDSTGLPRCGLFPVRLALALVGLVLGILLAVVAGRQYRSCCQTISAFVPASANLPRLPEAFTDWLARLIQEAAGPREGDPPAYFRRFGQRRQTELRQSNSP